MSANPDRLYELVPVVYRLRDAAQGYPLQALLRVINEQYDVLERDIARLYENWFIETCDDWVVPYIGDLIGYEMLSGPLQTQSARPGAAALAISAPRREVADTIAYRRRKGTLAVVQDVAAAVSGWPVKAVEFYRHLCVCQNINCLNMNRGRTAELRDCDALDLLGGAFDEMARNVDVRRTISVHSRGFGSIAELGVFVWRLKSYALAMTQAFYYDAQAPNAYLFNPLGHDTPLFTNPLSNIAASAPDLALPLPIRRRPMETRDAGTPDGQTTSGIPYYYGTGRSLMIWTGPNRDPVKPEDIVVSDLSAWSYRPMPGKVAVDPQLGRIVFAHDITRRQNVWVSYSYGFSADMGGGPYPRPIRQPADAKIYQVGDAPLFAKIGDALAKWTADGNPDAVIEITNSAVYSEPIQVNLPKGCTLQLRAAQGMRPVIRLYDWGTGAPDSLSISGQGDCWFVLDGVVVTGRGMRVDGDVSGVAIRHCTLVPGWGVDCNCEPDSPNEPSLTLVDAPRCITIEHSILGAIQIERDQAKQEPLQIRIVDSILDATSPDKAAIGSDGNLCAHATLLIRRSTVFGQVQVHGIELGEDTIFMGLVRACKRQQGCMRFCYAPPGSRTPRRYECQPDMVVKAVTDAFTAGTITATERDALTESESLRVEPEFNAVRYGRPTYCQLAFVCAEEIVRGAHDESEMGAFHDLYQPQRTANLQTRLSEYAPAGINAGVLFEN